MNLQKCKFPPPVNVQFALLTRLLPYFEYSRKYGTSRICRCNRDFYLVVESFVLSQPPDQPRRFFSRVSSQEAFLLPHDTLLQSRNLRR